MIKLRGLHHLAICTASIKEQIDFFTDVLGMNLVALYWMHGAEGAWHGFLNMNGGMLAFVHTPEMKGIPREEGKTFTGHAGGSAAPGTIQHIAFNVDTADELLEFRDRIRSRGVHVFGHIDHGFCKSIYFAGPENLTLEISTSEGEDLNVEAWIDPEVVRLAGISEEELESYKNPKAFVRPSMAVNQPVERLDGPRLSFPAAVYEKMLKVPDQVLLDRMSVTEPPVKVDV